MSGTSLDGIDVALITTDGEAVVHHGPSRTYEYQPEQRAVLSHAIADAKRLTDRRALPDGLAEAERLVTEWHAAAVECFFRDLG